MSDRSVSKVEVAREVADWLDAQGEHKRANDIRSLCRSNDSLRETCSRLSSDIAALRKGSE